MESAESFFAKGDSALHNENYNEALKCYFSVLRKTESMEQRGDSLAMKARMAIGAVYSVYGNTTAALRFYRQGLAMARALGDTEAEGKILHNMVQSYCSAGVLDSAYMCNKDMERLALADNGKKLVDVAFSDGFISYYKGNPHAAIGSMRRVLFLEDSLKRDFRQDVYVFSLISAAYSMLGARDSSEKYLMRYVDAAEKDGNPYVRINSYKEVLRHFTKNGDIERALAYLDNYVYLRDSVVNWEGYGKIVDEQNQYEAEKSTRRISTMQSTISLQKASIILAVILLVSVCAVSLVIWQKNRKLKRSYTAIYKRNLELMAMESELKEERARKRGADIPAVLDPVPGPENASCRSGANEELFTKVLEVMDGSTVYCNPDFSLAMLAEMVGSNVKYVSQSINECTGKNFRTFINEYRVKEARKRLTDVDEYGKFTIHAISESVGFRSSTNFISAFKAVTGMTPSVYQKIARSSHQA